MNLNVEMLDGCSVTAVPLRPIWPSHINRLSKRTVSADAEALKRHEKYEI